MPKAREQHVLFARVRAPGAMSFVYGLMAEHNRSMAEVVEYMIAFCREKKSFRIPTKDASPGATERRNRYRKLAKEIA